MKKKNYFLNQKRGLIKSKARFLSIFSIVFLGAAFFAGLKNTPMIMNHSMSDFLREYQYSDVNLISTFAFTPEDIELLKDIEGVEEVIGGYRFDALASSRDLKIKDEGVTVYSLSKNEHFNQVQLVAGRLPETTLECVIDDDMWQNQDVIGKTITLENDQGERRYTIVGRVNDTRYISDVTRGTNTLGDGTNVGFIFVLEDEIMPFAVNENLFDLREEDVLYNELYVSIEGTKDHVIFSAAYDEAIEGPLASINAFMQDRLRTIRNQIVADKKALIEEPEAQYLEGLAAYEKGEETFNLEINQAKIQLINAKLSLIDGKRQILDARQQMSDASGDVTTKLGELDESLSKLEDQLRQLTPDTPVEPDVPDTEVPEIPLPDDILGGLENIELTQEMIDDLADQVGEIRQLLGEATTLVDATLALEGASLQIESAELEIAKQESILENTEIETRRQLDESKAQLDEAKAKLDEAYKAIDAIPEGTLYSLSRHENAGLVSFQSDSDAIKALADIFPLMFFLVAALVSLTTMTRMVEEQRGQSGILRALGYSRFDVIQQYLLYALSATFFAAILGIVFGTYFFPAIIYYLYNSLMYSVNTSIHFVFGLDISIMTIFISVIVTLVATAFACVKELSDMPSVLMRPKAPKLGKRILLERITWLWKRLSFNYKVTMRNIFRYKKRFYMSILGISGCCALIIVGFGVKNSVSQIVPRQFSHVWHYNMSVSYQEHVKEDDALIYKEELTKQYGVKDALMTYQQAVALTSSHRASSLNGTIVVFQDLSHVDDFITLRTISDHESLKLDEEGVVINQKASELLGVKIGDTIELSIDGDLYSVKVSGICESYFMHHVYMSKEYYYRLLHQEASYNQALIIMDEMTSTSDSALKEVLTGKENVAGVTLTSSLSESFDSMIRSIDLIVIILIVCAGALAFIVLYNLTNINIQERKGEIATIKVLGFYPKEVYDYVFRENTFLALIGSLLGTLFGKILHYFIVMTVEVEMTMFVRGLNIASYIYGILITLLFTALINRIMRKVLRNVDMVESLKSVE